MQLRCLPRPAGFHRPRDPPKAAARWRSAIRHRLGAGSCRHDRHESPWREEQCSCHRETAQDDVCAASAASRSHKARSESAVEGKSVAGSVDTGGVRIIKKKNKKTNNTK